MAIIRFDFNPAGIPENAENVVGHHYQAGWTDYKDQKHYGPQVYWTWETHIGLCIREGEVNCYHDSDFYMIVWNPKKKVPERIDFASTRGWSYPSYNSYVDATPEVLAEFREWDLYQERKYRVQQKLRWRFIRNAAARQFGVRPSVIRKLELLHTPAEVSAIIKLAGQLDSKRLKSEFRRKLAKQVVDWMHDPNPKYETPLSRKQLQYI